MRRCAFPRKHAQRGASQPICGKLSEARLPEGSKDLIDRITIGVFLDMQNQPLADILAACYLTGVNHAIESMKDAD